MVKAKGGMDYIVNSCPSHCCPQTVPCLLGTFSLGALCFFCTYSTGGQAVLAKSLGEVICFHSPWTWADIKKPTACSLPLCRHISLILSPNSVFKGNLCQILCFYKARDVISYGQITWRLYILFSELQGACGVTGSWQISSPCIWTQGTPWTGLTWLSKGMGCLGREQIKSKYSQSLNNMDLNWAGPFICGFFFPNKYYKHIFLSIFLITFSLLHYRNTVYSTYNTQNRC